MFSALVTAPPNLETNQSMYLAVELKWSESVHTLTQTIHKQTCHFWIQMYEWGNETSASSIYFGCAHALDLLTWKFTYTYSKLKPRLWTDSVKLLAMTVCLWRLLVSASLRLPLATWWTCLFYYRCVALSCAVLTCDKLCACVCVCVYSLSYSLNHANADCHNWSNYIWGSADIWFDSDCLLICFPAG